MNKFLKSGSKLLFFITCFFIATLFIDQANLLDILVGNNENVDIEHPEEVDASLVESTPLLDQVSFERVISFRQSNINTAKDVQSISKRIIVDEDSPSTASVNVDAIIISNSFENERQDFYSFVSIRESIYLHNRTLLI
jgi:hypothetical protein